MKNPWAACAAAILLMKPVAAADAPRQSVGRFDFTQTVSATYSYLEYLPKDYDAAGGKKWPLILFLHGAGERGTDPAKVAVHGPPKLVAKGQDLPCVVISPDEMNAHLRTVIVAPMTTGSHPARFRVPITFQGRQGLIVLDQIRTLDRVLLVKRVGGLRSATLSATLRTLQAMFAP